MAQPSCSAKRESRDDRRSTPPVSANTPSRTLDSCSAESIALMSPKDSWKAATSMLAASNSCGLKESRSACPSSWHTMSGLSPEKTVRPGGRTMEELQPLAVIKRVEIDAEIEVHGQDRAHFPRCPRDQCAPEIGAAAQRFGRRPITKLRGSGRMRLRLRRRGRVDDPGRERLIPQNRNGSLEDLTSARLGAGAGIVLPTVDHSLRLRPAFRRDRAGLP